ncbi:anaphase-promoting complex subunit 13-like [Oncorhynchus clarkii lewisi]|uniref:anaphase-promoting complex subunit 13-like n=1 Tax=Oncorhynchus clarkii lewisi TaxID=490388 RepID=UPI0039B98060
MDSEVQRDGRVLGITDYAWREDCLTYEDVTISLSELPEAEQDNGGSTESVKEQEIKWSNLALQNLHKNTTNTGT